MKVLSVGPRTESELFKLVTMGFQLKNIKSIDIQSYSNLVQLGDAVDMPFEDNSFDLVIIGRILVYTNNPDRVIKETIRVLKNNGIVSMYHTHSCKVIYSNFDISNSKIMLDIFGKNLNKIYFKYHLFNNDISNDSSTSNFVISIKKNN